MNYILLRNKALTLLIFLCGFINLYAGAGSYACNAVQQRQKRIVAWNKEESCFFYNSYTYMHTSSPHAYLSFKIPKLKEEYYNYPVNVSASRRDRSIPILIEFNSNYLNPRKIDLQYYQASSVFKEKIIETNPAIRKQNCLYFASGSQYRFPVPAMTSELRVIIYYDLGLEKENIRFYKESGYGWHFDLNKFYQHRSLLLSDFTFEKGKEYELKIEVNPEVIIPDVDEHIPPNLNGFNLSIQELPPNTKFAFDGKDDVGKTYEQVKKEFILYDKDVE